MNDSDSAIDERIKQKKEADDLVFQKMDDSVRVEFNAIKRVDVT